MDNKTIKTKKHIKLSGKDLFNAIVIIAALVVLAIFCLAEDGLSDLINNIVTMDVSWILAAVFCNLLNILIEMWLIYILTKPAVPDFKFGSAFRCSMIGQFFSAVTPFSTGGQPMQIIYMANQKVKPGISTSMLVQKFLVYQSTLTVYSLIAILFLFSFFGQTMNGVMLSFSIFGFASQAFVIIMLLLFSFNKKLTHFLIVGAAKLLSKIPVFSKFSDQITALEGQLETFHKSNKELFKDRKLLIKSYALTAVQLTTIFIIPYCIYRAFNLDGANPMDMIFSQAFVTMTSCFIPLPGAAGASEVSFLGFFSNYFTHDTIKSAVLMWRIITYYSVILLTAPFSGLTKNSDNIPSDEKKDDVSNSDTSSEPANAADKKDTDSNDNSQISADQNNSDDKLKSDKDS